MDGYAYTDRRGEDFAALSDGVDDAGRVVELDTAFHTAVARATMNTVLIDLVTALNDAAREERVATYR
ncbi:MAG: hypothetical protein QOH46_3423, partial [Solirubrobacteraceae bacterium]|nr:hypothetical protein [Solirubrobacteraceae bacterium]